MIPTDPGKRDCTHPLEKQLRDGHGTVCSICGIIRVFG